MQLESPAGCSTRNNLSWKSDGREAQGMDKVTNDGDEIFPTSEFGIIFQTFSARSARSWNPGLALQ